MTDSAPDDPFDATTVRGVEASWSATDHAPTSGGDIPVQPPRLETASRPERAVLKTSPDDGHHGTSTEPRLLGVSTPPGGSGRRWTSTTERAGDHPSVSST